MASATIKSFSNGSVLRNQAQMVVMQHSTPPRSFLREPRGTLLGSEVRDRDREGRVLPTSACSQQTMSGADPVTVADNLAFPQDRDGW